MYCSITAFLDNEKEVLKQLRELPEEALQKRVFKVFQDGGQEVKQEAKLRASVRTGALKDSIKVKGSLKTLSVTVYPDYPDTGRFRKSNTKKQKAGAREYYAFAIEYGTRKGVKARPFLFPAAEAKEHSITEKVNEAMEAALHDTGSTA